MAEGLAQAFPNRYDVPMGRKKLQGLDDGIRRGGRSSWEDEPEILTEVRLMILPDLLKSLDAQAKKNGTTRAALVRHLIREGLERLSQDHADV